MAPSEHTTPAPVVQAKSKFPPWTVTAAIFVVLGTYLISQIAGQLIVSLYPLLRGWSAARAEDWLTSSTFAQFDYIAAVEAITLGLLYWFIRHHKTSFRALGLVRPRLRDVRWALVAVPVYFIGYLMLVTVVTALFPSIDVEQEQQIGFDQVQGTAALVLTFISLAVLPPIAEEIVMRGFLFESLKKGRAVVGAALFTSIIFALLHLQVGSGAPLLWIAAIDTFALSLVLCYMKHRSGSLWPGILLHGLKNTVAFLSIFIFKIT